MKNIPSLIKWTGSKRSQARQIASIIPDCHYYFEPFLGGGAVLYAVGRKSIAGDVYLPLVQLYKMVKTDPENVSNYYEQEWTKLQEDRPAYYYVVRDRFNVNPNPLDLCFIMRTCVNGIVRFNDKGKFNNSFHLSRPGMAPKSFRRIVESWHSVLQSVTLVCADYREITEEANKGDFVYLDPPYAGNYQRYTKDLDVKEFFVALEDLNRRGVKWALSFDGSRGDKDLSYPVPKDLYQQHMMLANGNSAVGKVLNSSVEAVKESLYLNF